MPIREPAHRKNPGDPMKSTHMHRGEVLLTLVTATAALSMLVMIIGAAV